MAPNSTSASAAGLIASTPVPPKAAPKPEAAAPAPAPAVPSRKMGAVQLVGEPPAHMASMVSAGSGVGAGPRIIGGGPAAELLSTRQFHAVVAGPAADVQSARGKAEFLRNQIQMMLACAAQVIATVDEVSTAAASSPAVKALLVAEGMDLEELKRLRTEAGELLEAWMPKQTQATA